MIATCIEWTPSMSVGHLLIDDQHKAIMKLSSETFKFIHSHDNTYSNAIRDHLLDLLILFDTHFETEEKLLREVRFPDVGKQTKEHREFKEKVSSMYVNFVEGEADPISLISYMVEWLNKDIAEEAVCFQSFFSRSWVSPKFTDTLLSPDSVFRTLPS